MPSGYISNAHVGKDAWCHNTDIEYRHRRGWLASIEWYRIQSVAARSKRSKFCCKDFIIAFPQCLQLLGRHIAEAVRPAAVPVRQRPAVPGNQNCRYQSASFFAGEIMICMDILPFAGPALPSLAFDILDIGTGVFFCLGVFFPYSNCDRGTAVETGCAVGASCFPPYRPSILHMNIVERTNPYAFFPTADTAVGGVKWSGLNLETIKSLVDDTAFDSIQPVVGQGGEILPVTDYACSLC